MKQAIFSLIVLSVLFFGCKRDPVPRAAIERSEFIDVLVEVHMAEAISREQYRLKLDSLESSSMYLSVLEKHHVSEERMILTSLYYSRNQDEYKKIYNEVLDKISMLIEDNNIQEEVIIDADSLKNAIIEKLDVNAQEAKIK